MGFWISFFILFRELLSLYLYAFYDMLNSMEEKPWEIEGGEEYPIILITIYCF